MPLSLPTLVIFFFHAAAAVFALLFADTLLPTLPLLAAAYYAFTPLPLLLFSPLRFRRHVFDL